MYKHATGKTVIGENTYRTIYMSPYYVVINVTDLKTNITKEICVECPSIKGAIEKDNNNSIIDKKNRTFKFQSDSALNYIGYFNFDTLKMKECIKDISPEFLMSEWNRDYINFANTYSGECQKYFAFILFKDGIMSSRGSLGSSLSIVTKERIEQEKKDMEYNQKHNKNKTH